MKDLFLEGRGSPVLLLHGLRGNPMELQLLAQRLHAAGHTVSVPFLPGYGHSEHDRTPLARSERWTELAKERLDGLVRSHGPVAAGGICIGANLALRLAQLSGESVSALLLISTTLFYDGWNLPSYRWLLPIAGCTPLRHCYSLREKDPYGVKNVRIREWIARQMENTGNSAAGARDLPLTAIHEAYRLMRVVKKGLREISQPALILHAAEDEIASLRSPTLLAGRLGSAIIRKTIFSNSYHMLTLDNDRDAVARASVGFLRELAEGAPHLARRLA
ncbi:MAG TPA: alpha/beta fold hydrolase [Noviherbaspirillum sp.]|uniref:alpha/beta hydrolase n=1 Tax=Noviherbaspirillum sp. TaxID=1926288 RepID=UPI002B45EB6E|nr:alpha/beta fold hydrolase [Noviherbaspirillum sp.]HJV87431.1 alpha/beta fold hydrolase [Noviherbaspirillum sp.]